jgi:hypothetical protein
VVREAKALIPSAWDWAHGVKSPKLRFRELARGRFRSPDPHLEVSHGFIVRRIAADSRKVNLDENVRMELRLKLLKAMGVDLGAIHAADLHADLVLAHLDRLPKTWLKDAAQIAAADVARILRNGLDNLSEEGCATAASGAEEWVAYVPHSSATHAHQ